MNNNNNQLNEFIEDLQHVLDKYKKQLETPKLEVGKVYKWPDGAMCYHTGIYDGDYGFSTLGKFCNGVKWLTNNMNPGFTEATPSEWEALLIKECEKRYKAGQVVQLHVEPFVFPEKPNYIYIKDSDILDMGGYPGNIYQKGHFAKVVEAPLTVGGKLVTVTDLGMIRFSNEYEYTPEDINTIRKLVSLVSM